MKHPLRRTPLSGQTLANTGWGLWGLGMTLVIAGLALLFINRAVPTPPRWGFRGIQSLIALPTLTAGAWIVTHRPRNRIGWLLLVAGFLAALTGVGEEYAVHALLAHPGRLPWGTAFASLSQWFWLPGYALLNIFVPLYFPNGRLVSLHWRVVAWLGELWIFLGCLWLFFAPGPLANLAFVENPAGLPQLASLYNGLEHYPFTPVVPGMILMLAAVLSLAVRYRRAGHVVQQQIKWFLLSSFLTTFAGLIGYSGYFGLIPQRLANLLLIAAIYINPLAILIAILRYDLYNIDLIINRALVYAALTAATIAFYIVVVGFFGTLLHTVSRSLIAFFATGLVAMLSHPLREWLQRRINHWMYGDRDDPYAVLTRLGQRLEDAVRPQAALPTIVETLAQTLKLPYVALALKDGDRLVEMASFGLRPANSSFKRLPLTHQRERIGALMLAPRSANEPFTEAEERLLDDLARQVEIAVQNVQLTRDLRRARQELVRAREEERRRIRRDLHDGLGPQLASQALTITAARRLYAQDPQAADRLLAEAIQHAQAATDDVRRLVHELRPPALDDLGLLGAIRSLINRLERSGLQIITHLPNEIGPLPAAVETACYFICQESLNNVIRHADASQCTLTLIKNEQLHLEITDDGIGFPADHPPGIGLRSMRRRAEEIGGSFQIKSRPEGGTQVAIRLPVK